MKTNRKIVTIRELVENYSNTDVGGVVGFNGKLNIRPPYQREFVYNRKQQEAVIESILKGFPLNVMWWSIQGDDIYEVLDGQQRTMSICNYVNGVFSYDGKFFSNQPNDIQDKILNYKLDVFMFEGTESEKLKWFEVINIAGTALTKQEIRNAVYTGPWVTDAKKYFSKNGCPAYRIGKDYLKGVAIQQDYLETVIKWISDNNITEYMSKNQHKQNANELWEYFESVIDWIKQLFPNYRKEMKGVDWGYLYNNYEDYFTNGLPDVEKDPVYYGQELQKVTDSLEIAIKELLIDPDVTKKQGIYMYLFTKEEKHLSIRAFTANLKTEVYEKQDGQCLKCSASISISEAEAGSYNTLV